MNGWLKPNIFNIPYCKVIITNKHLHIKIFNLAQINRVKQFLSVR
jgi:hypothetical protein